MNTLWPSVSGSRTSYLQAIRAYRMLSADEELALSRAWRDGHDLAAAHKLVTSHLRLVAKIAMEYRGYGLPIDDLVGEGNVGMMQAVKRFDPDRGCRLATYATWWIRAAIQEYILRSWSLVKIGTTAAQKKLFFNLRRLKSRMHAIGDGDLQADQVTKVVQMLGVREHDVVDMNRRLAVPHHSLNVPMRQNNGDEWQDWLVGDGSNQETVFAEHEELADRKMLLGQTFNVLDRREQHILAERWLKENPTTLRVLAEQCGVSLERVRQIERDALVKLEKAIKARMAARVMGAATAHAGRSVAAA